jgi:hypothetical protein
VVAISTNGFERRGYRLLPVFIHCGTETIGTEIIQVSDDVAFEQDELSITGDCEAVVCSRVPWTIVAKPDWIRDVTPSSGPSGKTVLTLGGVPAPEDEAKPLSGKIVFSTPHGREYSMAVQWGRPAEAADDSNQKDAS